MLRIHNLKDYEGTVSLPLDIIYWYALSASSSLISPMAYSTQ